MKLFALNRRQVIWWVLIFTTLLFVGTAFLYARACRRWQGAEIVPPVDARPESPYFDPAGTTQEARILPPEGYTRVPAEPGSFAEFLRTQAVYPHGSRVCRYDGKPLGSAGAAAVYTLSVGKDGNQQCADSIIRLRCDYAYTHGLKEQLSYHLTNGFLCDYATWCRGRRLVAFGEWAFWLPLAAPADNEQTYRDWLMQVMQFAGTRSLEKETKPISVAEAHTGDILCHGGSPGHAVMLVDEAQNEAGKRCFLIAQGFMPAQNCHIITGYGNDPSPWYTEEQLAGNEIRLSSYIFHAGEIRRFAEPLY